MTITRDYTPSAANVESGGPSAFANPFKLVNDGQLWNDARVNVGVLQVLADQIAAVQKSVGAREPALVAATGNLTLSGTQTIDGVAVGAGKRVLAPAQADATQNGLYLSAVGAWSRTADASTAELLVGGVVVAVQQGTDNGRSSWRLRTPSPIVVDVTPLVFERVATSPRMVSARDFAPFPSKFGVCQPTDARPILLSDLYVNVAAAQVDFQNLTATAELSSSNFAAASFDWAVIQEAIRYAEAHKNAVVHVENGLYGLVSGLEGSHGTLLMHGGIVIRGQGCQGTTQTDSVVFTHFSTGDLFEYDGGPVGATQARGIGGGLRDLICWKANRVQFGGLSYQGGRQIYIHASDVFRRPGEMILDNVGIHSEAGPKHQVAITAVDNTTPIRVHAAGHGLVTGARPLIAGTGIGAADGQTHVVTVVDANTIDLQGTTASGTSSTGTVTNPAALWDWTLVIDGSALRTSGGAGVREIHTHKLRMTGSLHGAHLLYTEHNCHVGLDTSIGNASGEPGGGSSGIIIEGDCNNIAFPASRLHGPVTVKATDPVAISAMSGSPATVTATGHGFPIGQIVNLIIEGTGGTTGVNGFSLFGTVADANTFTQVRFANSAIAVDATGYTSGGTIRSAGPREVHLMGTCDLLSITASDVTGSAAISHDIDPTKGLQSGSVWINSAPHFRCLGDYTPAFLLERKTAVANQTGDGTTYVVTFDSVGLNENVDDFGAGPPFGAYVVTCAGRYKFYASVLLSGVDGAAHKYTEITLTVNGAFVETKRIPAPPPGLGATFQSLDVSSPPLVLRKSDVVRVQVTTQPINVTNATNASPIVITTDVAHGHFTGDTVPVSGVLGNTAANVTGTITVVGPRTFSLDGTTGNGAYGGGGTIGTKTVGVTGDSGSSYTRFSGELL